MAEARQTSCYRLEFNVGILKTAPQFDNGSAKRNVERVWEQDRKQKVLAEAWDPIAAEAHASPRLGQISSLSQNGYGTLSLFFPTLI